MERRTVIIEASVLLTYPLLPGCTFVDTEQEPPPTQYYSIECRGAEIILPQSGITAIAVKSDNIFYGDNRTADEQNFRDTFSNLCRVDQIVIVSAPSLGIAYQGKYRGVELYSASNRVFELHSTDTGIALFAHAEGVITQEKLPTMTIDSGNPNVSSLILFSTETDDGKLLAELARYAQNQ